MEIKVDCYAGYRGEETPRRIWMGHRKIDIKDILDRWLAPDHRYFKVYGDDASIYIIRHDIESWKWELTYFQQQPPKSTTYSQLPESQENKLDT